MQKSAANSQEAQLRNVTPCMSVRLACVHRYTGLETQVDPRENMLPPTSSIPLAKGGSYATYIHTSGALARRGHATDLVTHKFSLDVDTVAACHFGPPQRLLIYRGPSSGWSATPAGRQEEEMFPFTYLHVAADVKQNSRLPLGSLRQEGPAKAGVHLCTTYILHR